MFVGKNGDPLVLVLVVDVAVVVVVDGGGAEGNEGEEKGFTSHGSIGNVEETGEDEDAAAERDVLGKLDMGKSGFIFRELASAFSCRRHFARRF